MRIMIMKCDRDFWYKDKISKTYTVEEETKDSYIVITKDQGGRFGIVSKKDAEVVD